MVVWKFNNLYKADAEKVSKEIESGKVTQVIALLEDEDLENMTE